MSTFRKFLRADLVIAVLALGGMSAPSFAQTSDDAEAAMARDLTVAQKPVYTLWQQIGQLFAHPMEVDAWVDNPSMTYAIGQPLRVMVRPKQDAYITVVDVGASGRVAVLYPNHFQRDAKVRGGGTVMIPAASASWQINVTGPAGVDLIQVIASRQPLSLPELQALTRTNDENPLISLGRSADDVARDLVTQLKPQPSGDVRNVGIRNLMIRTVAAPVAVSAAPAPAETLIVTTTPPAPSFGLSVRAERPVYRVGEPVRIIVSSMNDCRLTLIGIGASGSAVQLFPNAFQRENLIRAGQMVTIPSPQSPLQIVARAPSGVEGIMAVCRTASAPAPVVADQGFVTLGTLQTVGRDLMASVSAPHGSPEQAEQASTSYLVVE
jgi:hypothetical protein